MARRAIRNLLFPILLLFLCLPAAEALTLKIATLAPVGSPWSESLRRLSAEWDRISEGQVKLKIYAGGIAGEEADMIRKMRIGQLDGAALTQLGWGLLDPGILALSTPFLIQEEGELEYVMGRSRAYFESRLETAGYRLFAFSKAGWIHFFGREPLIVPEDLMRMKLGVPAGDADFVDTWRRIGFNAFSLPFGDILTGLQSGMIDAFYAPPLVAATFQWFGPARHMTALPIAPVVGAVVMRSNSLDRIPVELREALLATFNHLGGRLNTEMGSLAEEALSAMQGQGLQIHPVPAEAAERWRRVGGQGIQVVLGRMIPEEPYDLIAELVSEYGRRGTRKE
ncbi:MAG: TRAP transporter substrate-binding protein DctP [Spirochaetaceae bacterium]|nr:MAG: TRAP transporter substrate-binding protein DctP [Spirochaetaceae bacterium]